MKISVYGTSMPPFDTEVLDKAREIGREIARQGHVLITGACPGYPYEAVLGAEEQNGQVIGFSPFKTKKEHEEGGYPTKGFTKIRYTGKGAVGRNLMSASETEAAIIINGKIGTLNEFTIIYHLGKNMGVLKGSGGIADLLLKIIKTANKPTESKIVFEKDPIKLVNKLVNL